MLKLNNILFLLIITAFVGCSNQGTPESVAKNYYLLVLDSDYNQAYQYLSKSDKEAYSINEYVEMKSDSLNPVLRSLANKTEISINQVNTENSKATVTLDIKSPDAEAIIGDLLLNAFSGNMADTSKIDENISEMIEGENMQYKTSQKEFELVLEDNSWKIFEDLKTKKKKQEIEDTANSIINNAENLISDQNYDEAKEKVNEIFELDENYIQESMIQKAENLISKIELFDLVELYDVESRYINTYGDDKKAGIRFKIKNNSDQDLSKVAVKVYYLDSNGNRIHEKTFNPVLVTEFSFGNNDPLKAGYIYQMPERQFYTSDSVPNEWDEGKVLTSISDIEIMD